MTNAQIQELHKKEKKLLAAQDQLKHDFVGIDAIIEEFIRQVRVWYLMPDLLIRPVIINLWGMTGVGKTDLVRKFVSLIQFEDRFVEIELSNSNTSAYYRHSSSVGEILRRQSLNSGESGIAFFDEIQKFRTIEEDRKDVSTQQFQDFWELLSDGKLAKREQVDDWEELLITLWHDKERQETEKKTPSGSNDRPPSRLTSWELRKLKNLLKVKRRIKDLGTLSQLTSQDALKVLEDNFKNKKVFAVDDYRKVLIIVSGNLDEAYEMAKQTQEAEVDPDVFAAQASNINIIDIKQALTKRYKPEQVSRFGNIHLIYPSLTRKDFVLLIEKKLKEIERRVLMRYAVSLQLDESVHVLVYENGVFPVQGVRPVFSAIGDIIESHLAEFLFSCVTRGFSHLCLTYDPKTTELVVSYSNSKSKKSIIERKRFTGRVDLIRSNYSHKETMLTAVHEAGHAVLYVLAFGLAPLQLKANLASSESAGFTFPHMLQATKRLSTLKVRVLLAGMVAEQLVFGPNHLSAGSRFDLENATILVADCIRKFGFYDTLARVVTLYDKDASGFNTDLNKTNEQLESILCEQKKIAESVLAENMAFLRKVTQVLMQKHTIHPTEFMSLAKRFKIPCRIESEAFKITEDYIGLFNKNNPSYIS